MSTVSDPGVKHTQPVEESVEPTAHAVISLAEPRDLYGYRVYNATGTARAFAGRVTIYFSAGDEAMYAVVNRFLERIQWIQLIAWRNDTDATQQYHEVTAGFNLDHRDTSSATTTITVSVPPRSELVFYQKRFEFLEWGQEWNIGPRGGYEQGQYHYGGREYFIIACRKGPGSVTVDSVPAASLAGWTRKRERAKGMLTRMGL
ncbi:hypothetical protein CPB85DRAFT_1436404 [Mucidula mucida]|nr:hypothetical protein CPB85DRAFT_1436404 [Mucidula mucida]